MGLSSAGLIREKLVESGISAATAVAVVEQGTRKEQRVLLTTLDELPQRIASTDLASPALIIVGGVVTLAESLHWFGKTPMTDTEQVSEHRPGDYAALIAGS